jgi:chaperonin cofactor prefoldin
MFVLTSPVLGQLDESQTGLQKKLELISKQISSIEKRLLDIKTQIDRLQFEAVAGPKEISDKVVRDPAAIFRQQPQLK